MRSSNKLPTPSLPSTDWFLNLKPILPSFSLPNDETLNCLPSTSNNQLPKKTQDHQENHRNLTNSSILLFSNGKSIERSKFIGTNGNSVMLTPPHTPEDGLKFQTALLQTQIDYKIFPQRPPFNYQQLIVMALKSSKMQKLTLSEIYQWTQENFAYYRGENQSWKNSIRHNLSLNPSFEKIPKEGSGKNKGHYWALVGNQSHSEIDPANSFPSHEITKSYMIERKRTFQNDDFMEIHSKRLCTSSLSDSPSKISITSSDPTLNEVNSPPLPEIVLTFSETGNQMIASTSDSSLPPQDDKHLHVEHLVDIEGNDMWNDGQKEGIYDRDYVFPDNFDLLQEMDVDCYIPAEHHHWTQQAPHSPNGFNFGLGLNLNADLLDVYCSDL